MSGNSDQSGGAAPPQNLNQQQAPLQEERGQPHGPPPPGFHVGPPPYGVSRFYMDSIINFISQLFFLGGSSVYITMKLFLSFCIM